MKVNQIFQATIWVSLLSYTAIAARCNADNCARAATGTLGGSQSVRLAACSSYQACTLTPAITTTITNCPTSTPSFAAAACTNSGTLTSRYASACSCAGVTKTTSTYALPIQTDLSSNFALVAGKGLNARFIDLVGDPDKVLGGTPNENYGPVLRIQPVGKFSNQRFQLIGNQLVTIDGVLRAATFYDNNGEYKQVPISSFYMNRWNPMLGYVDDDYYHVPFAPFQCEFGDFDFTVPGYPLYCQEPVEGLSMYYHTDNWVLSLGNGLPTGQKPVDQLYAVAVPMLPVTPDVSV